MSNIIIGHGVTNVAHAADKAAKEDSAKRELADTLKHTRQAVAAEQARQAAEQARIDQAVRDAQARKREETNPGRVNTRAVTAAELARGNIDAAKRELDTLINGDPHGPATSYTFAKTARQVVETQVQTTEVVNRLGQQTSAQQVAVSVQYQVDRASGQVVGGHVGPPNQTSTLVNYHVDPAYVLAQEQKRKLQQEQSGQAYVPTNKPGAALGDHLSSAALAEHAKAGATSGTAVGIETNNGLTTSNGAGTAHIADNQLPESAFPVLEIRQNAANN